MLCDEPGPALTSNLFPPSFRTVASQVDSTGKLRAVTQLGVDYAQGYRVHRPEDIETFDFVDCGIQRSLAAGAGA